MWSMFALYLYFRCLKKLKDEFVEELVTRYGLSTLLKLKKMTKEERMSKSNMLNL